MKDKILPPNISPCPAGESLCPTQLQQDSAFWLQREQRHSKTSNTGVPPCYIHPLPLGSCSPS